MADIEEPAVFGHQNLTLLSEINDKAVVDNLKLRFERKKPFTFAGEVIISVNPYQSIHTDNEEDSVREYLEKEVFDRPPHIYGAVDLAYLDMKCNNEDTSIVFSGMCGSGKTEAAKKAMRYVANLTEEARRDVKVQNLLVNSNVVLESFGNAKTIWNNNSSRFGKCVQVDFNFRHIPEGGRVMTCTLETLRVVSRRQDERNFHHFYQLLAGASDSTMSELELECDPNHYHYLERGKEDGSLTTADKNSFENVSNAMELLHFTNEDQSDIRKILGAILHLGNVTFEDHCQESSENCNTDQIEKVAKLLGTSQRDIIKYLTRVKTSQSDETVEMEATLKEFETHRDELAMLLYSTLFDYIVSLINQAVAVDTPTMGHTSSMYILDYQGFEAYNDNSNNFYQFCVNYCSEKLHQVFVNKMLKQRQEEYICERLQWTHVNFVDDETVCKMIDDNDQGMLTVDGIRGLDQEDDSEENLLVKMDREFSRLERYSSRSCGKNDDSLTDGQFQIHHFFEKVTYDLAMFSAPKFKRLNDLRKLLSTCQLPMLKKLFTEPLQTEGSPTTDLPTNAASTTLRHNIVFELLEQIATKRNHYVCCLLPNVHKSPTEYDEQLVLNQVRAHCLVEHTKIQQAGYYCSMSYSSFVRRYKLLFTEDVQGKSDKESARELIKIYNFSQLVAFGKSKIFLQTPKTLNFLEDLRETRKPGAVVRVLNWYRRRHVQTWFKQVLNVFENCTSQPQYGMELQWPQPPATLDTAYCLLRKVQRNWWAGKKVKELNPSEQETVRLKSIALTLVGGRKFNWLHSDKWLGDELGRKELNPRFSEYNKKMKAYQDKNGDKKLLYSCHVIKLNRKMKPDSRICVLSECYLYRLDTSFLAKKRHFVGIGQIVGLSISPGNDQALVIHCVPEVGDIVFYVENKRPASELLAVIWRCYRSKYNKSLPVHVNAEIGYSRPGVRNGRLMCDPGSSLKRTYK